MACQIVSHGKCKDDCNSIYIESYDYIITNLSILDHEISSSLSQ